MVSTVRDLGSLAGFLLYDCGSSPQSRSGGRTDAALFWQGAGAEVMAAPCVTKTFEKGLGSNGKGKDVIAEEVSGQFPLALFQRFDD
jgi:hypothetical protein